MAANLGAIATVYAALIETVPFCRVYPAVAMAWGAIVGMGINFTASRHVVFKRPAV